MRVCAGQEMFTFALVADHVLVPGAGKAQAYNGREIVKVHVAAGRGLS